jgi:diguanylate cyclase (GGDEF)-like protein
VIAFLFGLAALPLLAAVVRMWRAQPLTAPAPKSIRLTRLLGMLTLVSLAFLMLGVAYLAFVCAWRGTPPLLAAFASLIAATLTYLSVEQIRRRITDLTQNGAESEQERRRWREVVENLPWPLALLDETARFTWVNPSFAAWFGQLPSDLTERPTTDFLPFSTPPADAAAPQVHEATWSGPNGPRPVEVHTIPLHDAAAAHLLTALDLSTTRSLTTPLQARIQVLEHLQRALRAIFAAPDVAGVLQAGLEAALALSGATEGLIALVERSQGTLRPQVTTARLRGLLEGTFRPGEDLPGKVWQSGALLTVADYPSWANANAPLRPFGWCAAVGAPLLAEGAVVGVMALGAPQTGAHPQPLRSDGLEELGAILSQALENVSAFQRTRVQLREAQAALTIWGQRSRLERLITAMSTHFINAEPAEIERSLPLALQTVAQSLEADRSYLVLFNADDGHAEVVGAWHRPTTPDPRQTLGELQPNGQSWWLDRLNRLETVQITDLNSLPYEAGPTAEIMRRQGMQFFTAVPLISKRAVVGYLGLDGTHPSEPLSATLLTLLKDAGEMFVSALERKWAAETLALARQHEQAQSERMAQSTLQSHLITEMGDLLLACRTADEAHPIIGRYMRHLLPNVSGSLYLIRNPEDPAEQIATWGEAPPPPIEHELIVNECWGMRRGRLHRVLDTHSEPLCGHIHAPAPAAYLCAPLIAQGETIGLLHLRAAAEAPQPSARIEASAPLAVTVAGHIALALSNLNLRDKLRGQAIRDPLTGLFNRRYMEATLERELRRASRHATTVGVIMFDVDHMKPINDALGHDAGDTLLKGLGELMMRLFRGEDVACRYGGDEFTIVLPEASLADAWQRAEQLREAFRRLELVHNNKPLGQVTLSIGVALFPDHGATAERLLQAADSAAYIAKSEGGDRVMVGKTGED